MDIAKDANDPRAGETHATRRAGRVEREIEYLSVVVRKCIVKNGVVVGEIDDRAGRALALLAARLQRHHPIFFRLGQAADVVNAEHVGKEGTDLIDRRESLQNRDEAPMLARGSIVVDDVVVEVIGPIAWSYGRLP